MVERLLRKIKPPEQLTALMLVVVCVAIFSGGLFCVFNWRMVSQISAQASALGRSFAFELGVSPLSSQTLSEAFFTSLLLLLTFSGLVLIYDSASKPRETRDSSIIAAVGLLLLIVGLVGWWWLAYRIFFTL